MWGGERDRERRREVRLLLDTLVQSSDDLFRQMVLTGVADELRGTLILLFHQYNDSMIEVGREYGCVVPLIGDKLQPVWVSR